ncbi:MAG: TonB-dependent receptor [Ignavibacteriales bacterium]|nr:TonB-dependent receptor [Ignavibacteriales bacterium]
MVDGFPETEPDGRTSFDMVEPGFAEKVEVIRSNASALWGNAAGGIINVNTVPDFSGSFLNVTGALGGFGTTKALVKTGFSFESGQVIVGFANNHMDGWRVHSQSHRTMATLAFINKMSPKTTMGVYVLASRAKFLIPGPLSQKQYEANAKQANFEYNLRDERRFNRVGRIGLNFEHMLNDMHSFSMMTFVQPKFLQRSERNTFRDFNRYHIGGNVMYRNTLQFDNGVVNKLVAGFDEAYQDGSIQFYGLTAENQRDSVLKDNKREGANTLGAFLQNEIIFDRLSFLAGIRYDKVTYYSEKFAVNNNKFYTSIAGQDKAFEKITPKLGITYKLTDNVNIYTNLGGGVEVPAGNETDDLNTTNLINPLLEPIVSTTFELGLKCLKYEFEGFVKGISFDVAGYIIKVKDDIIPYQEGKYYQTIGKSSRTGVEVNVVADLALGLRVSEMLTASSNKYDTYTLTKAIAGKDTTYDGNKAPGLPEFTNTISINYRPEFFRALNIGMQARTIGKYFADDANTLEVPAYTMLNANIMYENVLEALNNTGIRAVLSVYNLTDEKYIASAFINPVKYSVAGSSTKELGFIEPGLPLNASFTLTFLF